jgi:hypothetical protein
MNPSLRDVGITTWPGLTSESPNWRGTIRGRAMCIVSTGKRNEKAFATLIRARPCLATMMANNIGFQSEAVWNRNVDFTSISPPALEFPRAGRCGVSWQWGKKAIIRRCSTKAWKDLNSISSKLGRWNGRWKTSCTRGISSSCGYVLRSWLRYWHALQINRGRLASIVSMILDMISKGFYYLLVLSDFESDDCLILARCQRRVLYPSLWRRLLCTTKVHHYQLSQPPSLEPTWTTRTFVSFTKFTSLFNSQMKFSNFFLLSYFLF